TLELGPEIESDMTIKLGREVEAERFTRLDRVLLRNTNRGFLVVSAMPPEERQTHASHMGRLRKLEDLGLAKERQTGVWELTSDMEAKLKSLGNRGDIIKTMHRALRETGIDRPGGSYSVFDTVKPNNRIVGRVAGIGLTDEINDRHYLVVEGIDGKVHYADVGHLQPEFVPEKGMIVALVNKANTEDERLRTRLRILSYLSLEKLMEAEGATWLDKELLSRSPERLVQTGFGAETNAAVARRRQWLVSQRFGIVDTAGNFQPQSRLLEKLKQRDIRQATQALSKELGLAPIRPVEGERMVGTYDHAINLASGKYAVIQKSKEFILVPWRPELEATRGKPLSGTGSNQGISWDWTGKRQHSLAIS
ncbi:MAG: DUF3363 domain-containing protein, partial [Fimbriimonadaceae bacterium]|nr:DUF3363 domain-containing protein [Alphaproteobacteria bacterium]